MKKILLYTTAAAAIAGIAGCELVREEYSNLDSSTFPISENDARDLVTSACYLVFRNDDYQGVFNIATGIPFLSDMATDMGHCSWGLGDWGPLTHANFLNREGARNMRASWKDRAGNGFSISHISKMEMAIDRIKSIENMNADKKEQYIAELEIGQAWLAFLLWDWYGGLVIADLETLKKPFEEKILPRQSYAETAAYIEGRIRSALARTKADGTPALPARYDKGSGDYGRFTSGLAHMILLKLYMQLGGQYDATTYVSVNGSVSGGGSVNGEAGWKNSAGETLSAADLWGKAVEEGNLVIGSGYQLVTTEGSAASAYANVFASANEGNLETIWATNGLREFQYHLWYPHVISWGGYKITHHYLNKVFTEPNDTRGQEPVIQDAEDANGMFPVKYDMADRSGDDCYTDWIVYRLADALLLTAEALVKKNGLDATAVDYVNQIRLRAGLQAKNDWGSAQALIDGILLERARELWFEGCRRQDLIRNHIYVSTMLDKATALGYNDCTIGQLAGDNPPNGGTADGITDAHLFALPTSAINEFKKGGHTGQQNGGYAD